MAFLLPADTFEGVFASTLWNWIARNFRLRTVVTFAPEAAPFPALDTNVLIVAVENAAPYDTFIWARMLTVNDVALKGLLREEITAHAAIEVCHRYLDEALETGLTRPPRSRELNGMCLGDVAQVMRGIATGANDFFFLTKRQIDDYQLNLDCFVRAIGRTRDCPGEILEAEQLENLDREGRPTWLLNLPDRPAEAFSLTLQRYLEEGEARGLPERPLIRMRKRWYRGEQRVIPPLLFAYLGRRTCRFVLNRAKVLPLTGFLCVYPRPEAAIDTEALWRLLNDPRTLEQLPFVGKSYGSGAVKVEPRALERLALPAAVCKDAGLKLEAVERQMTLMETPGKYIEQD
ncbi:MAG: Eco57I restriction-modification methylase domain-containing protein, partial [Gammaproteobacteria bacterium]